MLVKEYIKASEKNTEVISGYSALYEGSTELIIHKKSPIAPMTIHFLTPIL